MGQRGQDYSAWVAQELEKHSDTDIAWDRWYCECGVRLRGGHTELAAHRRQVEQELREESIRG